MAPIESKISKAKGVYLYLSSDADTKPLEECIALFPPVDSGRIFVRFAGSFDK